MPGDPEKLRIMVRDNGVGFPPEVLAGARGGAGSPPLRKRKHGLRIMQGLMDEVEIVSGSEGTTIVMSKLR